ncbi:hypothetical protein [Streptomyces sp. CB01201]|uniref:hypothetical protein n=1 Tax=Streptomyces sp. CB01201 TaxID=2020324 RepID=UPI0018FEB35E|nr:hypothetical protein [Streptomyces sp. CB01201]
MQTISDRSAVDSPVRADLLAVLAGAVFAASAVGAALAYADLDSPLRAPLALFYLLAAPTEATAFLLRRLEPLARWVASLSGAVLIDLLAAETMAGLHLWSTRNGVTAVGAISLLLFLLGTGTGVNPLGTGRERTVENSER